MQRILSGRTRERGFTLVELMVASAIGLGILAAMSTLFLSNSRAQNEIERANRQVENGRFALQLMGGDLRSAGFLAQFDPNVLAMPAAPVDPCSVDLDTIKSALPLHIQGYDANDGGLSCISDVKTGTDVLVVRRTSSCVLGATGCETAADGGPFFQASLCNDTTELKSPDTANHYVLSLTNAGLGLHLRDCTTVATVRRFLTRIYYIANNDRAGDGIPTLKRAELTSVGGTTSFVIQSQVNGIENMQFEYGIDTDNNGTPDIYSANPAVANGCADNTCAVANWASVMTVKINLLARNGEPTPGYEDKKNYNMGLKADGTANTVAATRDAYKRHLFQAMSTMPNPAGRRQ